MQAAGNAPLHDVFDSGQWKPEITVMPAEDDSFEIPQETPTGEIQKPEQTSGSLSSGMREEIKEVLVYMDRLLENLPEEKISEFAQSEYFTKYKKLFDDLGLS
ncbi:MAG: hypothetical protein R3Y36_00245 [Spirochaetales bacterium]